MAQIKLQKAKEGKSWEISQLLRSETNYIQIMHLKYTQSPRNSSNIFGATVRDLTTDIFCQMLAHSVMLFNHVTSNNSKNKIFCKHRTSNSAHVFLYQHQQIIWITNFNIFLKSRTACNYKHRTHCKHTNSPSTVFRYCMIWP